MGTIAQGLRTKEYGVPKGGRQPGGRVGKFREGHLMLSGQESNLPLRQSWPMAAFPRIHNNIVVEEDFFVFGLNKLPQWNFQESKQKPSNSVELTKNKGGTILNQWNNLLRVPVLEWTEASYETIVLIVFQKCLQEVVKDHKIFIKICLCTNNKKLPFIITSEEIEHKGLN